MDTPNVYIFNKIKQNDADIQLLETTFRSLGCIVSKVNNAPLDVLKSTAQKIKSNDFSKFNYVIIFVLDNTNNEESLWTTTDNKIFHINGHLLLPLYESPTLKGKLRLGIFQNNRVFNVGEPVIREASDEVINPLYELIDVKLYATSPGVGLKHIWKKYEPSPYIRILCEEFSKTINDKKEIEAILNAIVTRVDRETGERPAKEMGADSCIFGHALY